MPAQIKEAGEREIRAGVRTLMELDLSGCVGFGYPAVTAILSSLTQLTSLNLLGFDLARMRDFSLSQLSNLLSLRLGDAPIEIRRILECTSLRRLHLTRCTTVHPESLALLSCLTNLTYLDLEACKTNQMVLSSLRHLPLRTLHVTYSFYLAAKHLAEVNQELTDLDLSYSSGAADALLHLTHVTALRCLRIVDTKGSFNLRKAAYQSLMPLYSGLRHLTLHTKTLDSQTTFHLRSLTRLVSLELSAVEIPVLNCAPLRLLPCLEKLAIDGVSDKQIPYIGNLTNLRDLRLYRSEVSDAGILHLTRLTGLKFLEIAPPALTLMHALSALTTLEELIVGFPVWVENICMLFHLVGLRKLQLVEYSLMPFECLWPLTRLTNLRFLSLKFRQKFPDHSDDDMRRLLHPRCTFS